MSGEIAQLRATRPGASDVLLVPVGHAGQVRALGWTLRDGDPGDPPVPHPMPLGEALSARGSPPGASAPGNSPAQPSAAAPAPDTTATPRDDPAPAAPASATRPAKRGGRKS